MSITEGGIRDAEAAAGGDDPWPGGCRSPSAAWWKGEQAHQGDDGPDDAGGGGKMAQVTRVATASAGQAGEGEFEGAEQSWETDWPVRRDNP